MDIWDALKLMARRWYVSVPMVLLTLVAVAWTLLTVEPRHTSDGHIMLVPPRIEINPGEDSSYEVNPWDTDALTAAIVTRLRNRALFEQLADEGYRATWEADTDLQFRSVIVIQASSDSPGDAQATVQRLLQFVEQEIAAQQQQYNLPAGAEITSLRLDSGENLEVARGNQARALVVVLGIGGILILVTTVSTDVLMRSRARRRSEVAQRLAAAADQAHLAVPVAAKGNGSEPAPPSTPAQPPARASADDRRPVNYWPPPSQAAESAPDRDPEAADNDATIILPLAKSGWERQSRSGGNAGDFGDASM